MAYSTAREDLRRSFAAILARDHPGTRWTVRFATDGYSGPCARCGEDWEEHPGVYCPGSLDENGWITCDSTMFAPADE